MVVRCVCSGLGLTLTIEPTKAEQMKEKPKNENNQHEITSLASV